MSELMSAHQSEAKYEPIVVLSAKDGTDHTKPVLAS
jgi:hypothetical protein